MSLKPNIFEQRSNKIISLLREEISERDQTIKELREALKDSFQALNDAYEECLCEEQNLIKGANKYSEKVRVYKEKARKLIEP